MRAVAVCLILSAGAHGLPQRDLPEALFSHPGLESGAWDEVIEDILSALEADPGDPWARTSVATLEAWIDATGGWQGDGDRLLTLARQLEDPLASVRMRRIVEKETRRRRFSPDPIGLGGEDLWYDMVREWRWIGPLGDLDRPAPMLAIESGESGSQPVSGMPEHGVKETHSSSWGGELPWRPLRRSLHSLGVNPAREMEYSGRGVGYLVAYLRTPAEPLALEVSATGSFEAFWNGRLVTSVPTWSLASAGTERFRADVAGQEGWNELLLRFPTNATNLTARVLSLDGRSAIMEQLDAGATLPDFRRDSGQSGPAAWSESMDLPPLEDPSLLPALRVLESALSSGSGRALAVPGPAAGEPGRRPWLLARAIALSEAEHLPAEVRRRMILEGETELEANGGLPPHLSVQRIARLIREDRPLEALAEADALTDRIPKVAIFMALRTAALERIDSGGELGRQADLLLLERFPQDGETHHRMGRRCLRAGDLAGAKFHFLQALTWVGNKPSIQDDAFGLLAHAGGEDLVYARNVLARWEEMEPGNERPGAIQHAIDRQLGDDRAVERYLREEVERRPHLLVHVKRLASFLASRGRVDEASALFEAILEDRPGDREARAARGLYGAADPAEDFFSSFEPDRERALAAGSGALDATVAELLDSGMVYLYPDGSSRHRMHTISLALDRKGTEELHSQPVAPDTRLCRVVKADGSIAEPVEVDGSWVMPSLEPGDSVEMVWEEFRRGLPGVAPVLSGWRFSSFERPFVCSRYVIFVPEGLEGRIESFQFDGESSEIPWGGGTVHVFETKGGTRQREEPLRPSYEEILPWLQFGDDEPLEYAAAAWASRIEQLGSVTEDIGLELDLLLEGLDSDVGSWAWAEELQLAVTERILDFQGEAQANQVWASRRGEPLFLLGALFERAGLEPEWVVLESAYAPELDPRPVKAFTLARDWNGIAMVLELERDGDPAPAWFRAGSGRGAQFGVMSPENAGARCLFLDAAGKRWRSGEVSRQALEGIWDSDLELVYTLQEDGTAHVQGRWRRTTPQGSVLREQVSSAGQVQRDAFVRSVVSTFVPGLDLEGSGLVGLRDRGAPLELTFEGSIRQFVQEAGGTLTADLRVPPTRLSSGLGGARRVWPVALRVSQRERVRVRLEPGSAWTIVGGPEDFTEERPGFLHSLEGIEDGEAREWHRRLLIRGPRVEAGEMGTFLQGAAAREREEAGPVRLERR